MFRLRGLSYLLVGFLAMQTPCLAQPSATATAIHEASFRAGLGKWVDAIEQYQRIIETAGDDLVPVEPPIEGLSQLVGGPAWTVRWSAPRSLPARWICHEHIGRFPPSILKMYRERVDRAAANSLERARERNDQRAIEAVVATWFNSIPGEEAIVELVRRAFERSEIDAAANYWKMLLPGSDGLHYPDPRTKAADVRAQLLLLKLFRGEIEQVRLELQAYRQDFPQAAGLLAGREGNFAETLETLLKDPKQVAIAAAPDDGRVWSTFAGVPLRNSLITNLLPRYWPGPPTWRTELPKEKLNKIRGEELPGPPDHPRALAFHPVIAKGRAFVADAMRVYAIDLLTGDRATEFDLRKEIGITGIKGVLPVNSDVRYSLTFADSYLYVRLGTQALRSSRDEGMLESASAIVCLGPIPDKKSEPIPHAWTLRPPRAEKDATVIFEGSPLVSDGKLFTAIWKQTGGGVSASIVGYRLMNRESPPELLWERDAGKSGFEPASGVRTRHDLLTLAGNNVVFCTNAGNIIAIDVRTGKVAWAHRYAANERRPSAVGRTLCPCVYEGGRIFIAPIDSHRLICLDAFTGRSLWERDGVDVVHLLGVVRGRLIATFAGNLKGIRGLAVESGSERHPDGWVQHDGGGATTFGRGLLTPDLIYWPTEHGLQFLRPDDGSPIRQPISGLLGNLAYADGCFIATNATEVLGFVTEGKLLERGEPMEKKLPGNRLILFRPNGPDRLGPSLYHARNDTRTGDNPRP